MKREREHHWAGCSCTEFVTYHGDTYCTTCGIRKTGPDQHKPATIGVAADAATPTSATNGQWASTEPNGGSAMDDSIQPPAPVKWAES